MTKLEQNIVDCLKMFGPCTLRTIQEKLDLRKMVLSQNDIERAANDLLKSKIIQKATGFDDIAYKV